MSSKDSTLYCRLTADMKARVESEAMSRGESSSVIVREALREYFKARDPADLNGPAACYRVSAKAPPTKHHAAT